MEPHINIGVLSAPQIQFIFNGKYSFKNKLYSGLNSVVSENGKIRFDGKLFDKIIFLADDENTASFDLLDVVIGIGFHWERKENQRFKGNLKLIVENNQLTAINILPVEDYLLSVISSEMSATSSLELLKAHAVISRSWLLAQLKAKGKAKNQSSQMIDTQTERIKWYDKDDHENFDVCADDHCQRYQGITRATTDFVQQAIEATRGQVLIHNKKICDTRFSKCCGGISELFENCWQPVHYDYLLPVEDKQNGKVRTEIMTEQTLEQFVRNPIKGDFCNTKDAKTLSQVLNSYDLETPDFYRWQVDYSQTEISELLRKRLQIDFGEIIDLQPVERGVSGRLIKLRIVGTKRNLILGKELEIRKALSNSHLYSSAFIVDKKNVQNNVPQTFSLLGAGWGHGVGLCQIGAAIMAEKGYSYNEILFHYFKNAQLQQIY